MKLNKRYWNLYPVTIFYPSDINYIYPENKEHEKWFFNYNLVINCKYKFKYSKKENRYFICG